MHLIRAKRKNVAMYWSPVGFTRDRDQAQVYQCRASAEAALATHAFIAHVKEGFVFEVVGK